MNNIDELNLNFSLNPLVRFTQGQGKLPFIEVNTSKAKALISLHGGQVLSYQPVSSEHDLFFLSNNAYYQEGKAIKGGAPICWPWFAANPDDSSLPFHGLVRNQLWQVESVNMENDVLCITLLYSNNELTQQLWPNQFELRETITIGDTLGIELTTKNTSQLPFTITQAIHSYFQVGDISQVQVNGLDSKKYLDKVEQFKQKTQSGPINVDQEVDRIYQGVDSTQEIIDKAFDRKITITHSGSETCVVWNPWVDISHNSQDLEDTDYRYFICVETANAANDIIKIEPGEHYSLSVSYELN